MTSSRSDIERRLARLEGQTSGGGCETGVYENDHYRIEIRPDDTPTDD